MPRLKIVLHPDDILREKAESVTEITSDLRQLVTDMFDTMYTAPGVGLAAPQVGQLHRIFVMDVKSGQPDQGVEAKAFINPEIIAASDRTAVVEEGCLSIPGIYANVKRPAEVTVRYRDIDWQEHEETVSGFEAACIQHEIDHLDGVLFLDHLSRLKRDMCARKYTKIRTTIDRNGGDPYDKDFGDKETDELVERKKIDRHEE